MNSNIYPNYDNLGCVVTISKVIDNNFFIIILGNKTRLWCYIWLTSSCFFNIMIMIVMVIIIIIYYEIVYYGYYDCDYYFGDGADQHIRFIWKRKVLSMLN